MPDDVAPASTASPRSGWITLALVVLTIAAYANSLGAGMLFDDLVSLAPAQLTRTLEQPVTLLSDPRPLTTLSFALNAALTGDSPAGFRVINIALHITAGLVLFGLVRRLARSPRVRPMHGSAIQPGHSQATQPVVDPDTLAGMAAALWLLHPVQTQAVTYLVQRAESLMGMFYLLTLYAVVRAIEADESRMPATDRSPRRGGGWAVLAVACCALGMLAKQVTVTAPLLALLLDRTFYAGDFRTILRRRGGLHLGLLACWSLLFWGGFHRMLIPAASSPVLASGTEHALATPGVSAGFGVTTMTPAQYLLTQGAVVLHYLRLSVWPASLCLDYGLKPLDAQSLWPWMPKSVVLWGSFALAGVLALASLLSTLGWRSILGFLGVWWFLILAPTSSFVPILDLVFEHRMYLALAAPMTLAAWLGLRGWETAQRRAGAVNPGIGWFAWVAVLVCLTGLTMARNTQYESNLTIWQDTVKKRPDNARAWFNLGMAQAQAGALPLAQRALDRSIEQEPKADALSLRGHVRMQLGDLTGAIEDHTAALKIKPDFAAACNNRGIALQMTGRFREAVIDHTRAIELQPERSDSYYNRALALGSLGQHRQALSDLEHVLRFRPDMIPARIERVRAWLALGRRDLAAPEMALLQRLGVDLSRVTNPPPTTAPMSAPVQPAPRP